MMIYPSMSYWDVHKLPLPVRRWLIRRHNKHDKDKNATPDDAPLSASQKMKYKNLPSKNQSKHNIPSPRQK
jgi:hypothetical protein